jgi:glucokinase
MSLPEPILVFDIGGTKVAAGVLMPNYTVSHRREITTQAAEGPEHVATRIVVLGREVLSAFTAENAARVRCAGVASAGQIDRQTVW